MLQDFDVDLEGAQTLRILCYKQEHELRTLIGKCAFEVHRYWFLLAEMKSLSSCSAVHMNQT